MNEYVDRLAPRPGPYLNADRIAEFMLNFPNHIKPTFLVSFPRSGNGFFRYIAAKAALNAQGYDLSKFSEDRYHYFGKTGTARRFTVIDTGEQISIEEITPDFHMNSPEKIAAIDPRFYFGDGPLIKSHFVIPDGAAPYIYLFRDPSVCTASYFNLVAGPELVEKVIADQDRATFNGCITAYLKVYSAMGYSALRHAKTGQSTLMPLARIEAGEFPAFCHLIAEGYGSSSAQDVQSILAANPKESLFDQRLLDLIGPDLQHALSDATAVFDALNDAVRS